MTKSNRPMVRIHDLSTDIVIDREMNDEEFAAYQAQLEANAKAEAEVQAKTAEKQSLLAKLGITEDEAKLLLS